MRLPDHVKHRLQQRGDPLQDELMVVGQENSRTLKRRLCTHSCGDALHVATERGGKVKGSYCESPVRRGTAMKLDVRYGDEGPTTGENPSSANPWVESAAGDYGI